MTVAPIIETTRLMLRAPEAGDIPAWTAFIGSDRARFMGGPIAPDRAWRIFASIAGHWSLRGYGSWTVTDRSDGRALGIVGIWHPDDWPEPELTYSIWSAEDEGCGFAYEAVRAARDFSLAHQGLETLVSYIDAENARSIRLAERLGARLDPTANMREGDEDALAYRHSRRAEAAA